MIHKFYRFYTYLPKGNSRDSATARPRQNVVSFGQKSVASEARARRGRRAPGACSYAREDGEPDRNTALASAVAFSHGLVDQADGYARAHPFHEIGLT